MIIIFFIVAVLIAILIGIYVDKDNKANPDILYERWREENHVKDL